MLTLVLQKDGKKEVYEREDANLIEMESFFELQGEVIKGIKEGTVTKVDITRKQVAFIAQLFAVKNVSEEDIRKGWKAKEFGPNCEAIFKEIAPDEYEDDEDEKAGKK